MYLVLAASMLLGQNDDVLAKMQGTWNVTGVARDGRNLPNDTIKGWTMTVQGNKCVLKAGQEGFEGVMDIAPKQMRLPLVVDIVLSDGPNKGKTMKDIFEVAGVAWALCLNEPGKDERPTVFAANPRTTLTLYALQRPPKNLGQ